MIEIAYAPEVRCTVEPGTFENQITVGVSDEKGNTLFLQVHRNFVRRQKHETYLPIGIIQLDYRNKRALIELPREADSGLSRLWVPFDSFRVESEEP